VARVSRRRIAFVGQELYFRLCSLEEPAGGLEPAFFDFRSGAPAEPLLTVLEAFDPDVIWVWRPEIVPHGLLRELRAVTVGYLTEPLPRDGAAAHPDLELRLNYLRAADPANFDRIVALDPHVIPAAERVLPVWRSLPIPVADRLYADVRLATARPRFLFHGRSTPHREALLGPLKHDHDVLHIAHGVFGDELVTYLGGVDAGVNLHNEDYPTYENRLSGYLAAGLLVLSEPLSPTHGLRPGTDYLEVRRPIDLWRAAEALADQPDAFRHVRLRGRRHAERFRASTVFPRTVEHLLADTVRAGRRAAA
jgi:hypothetical protein